MRVSLEVTREAENSKFVADDQPFSRRCRQSRGVRQRDRLANAGMPISKWLFLSAASNEDATYNWDIGTIQRPNAQERQFEVASHRWIDLTDKSGSFGTTILTEYKNGSDKPNDNTIRLTLLRSPGMQPPTNGRPQGYSDQANQDWGHHEFLFGLAGHAGDWRQAQTDWQAYRLSDPLIAFQSTEHPGLAGQELFPGSPQQFPNSRARSQESGSQRRNHSPHGRARRSSSARMCASLSPGRSSPPAKSMPTRATGATGAGES